MVGLRRPTAARSPPVRALKSRDLPAPVGPASATTVDSIPRPSRAPALLGYAPRGLHCFRVEPTVRDADCLGERGQAPVEIDAHDRASDAVDRGVEARDRLRLGGLALEQCGEAVRLVPQKPVDPFHEVVPGARGERAHRLVAEQRLEELVPDSGGAARNNRLEAR